MPLNKYSDMKRITIIIKELQYLSEQTTNKIKECEKFRRRLENRENNRTKEYEELREKLAFYEKMYSYETNKG